ncbi:MAG: hypothetical protein COA96_11820 [SAR86 cluster bacterium]|uniref:Uncharacterized protein n=1 Tax=SAR86 cluster bacterium TaxID=2030880 RepID=A0A2A5AWF1_9GAMM|nr:MAG: hypothetical protein COA96_11820 [SAR86 cluster bacterium]
MYWLSAYAILMLVNTVFEYGLEIIEDSAIGKSYPPQFSNDYFKIFTGRGRFSRQMLMILILGGIVGQLFSAGFDYLALFMLCFIVAIFPASLVINSLYENLLEIINPISLIGFIVIVGKNYVLTVAALGVWLALFYVAFSIGLGVFLLYFPVGLFMLFVYFRYLGLVAFRRMDKLFPERDYQAEDRDIDQRFDDDARLHEFLSGVYWRMKENQVSEVIALLDPVIKLREWARFDIIFSSISDWPNKEPAIHFIKLYVTHLMKHNNAMRALSLCEWALDQDFEFYIENETVLEDMLKASVSKEQFVVMVKLLENFVANNPGHEYSARYIAVAADICQSKLHHEEKFNQLQKLLDQLERDA